ncbi:CcmD family protein [Sphaerobacter sp.]|uniref:CcmD family protein n=1 Tax=Sphaerobacter sp. TaxID=2099654 RepID=UPI001DEE1879|nr:CcmD family protein [Sphaerobacter sp.]MBX5444030.1 CcmD family protein [Sphaerobacter sp.]
MGDNLIYLFVAFLITWLIMAAYLWSIGRQVRNLRDEVEALENAELPAEAPTATPRRQEQVESSQA